MTGLTTTRKRPSSAYANDTLIRETAISLLASRGIAGFTLAAVARAADLSHTALSKRFEHRDDLLCDVWEKSAQAHLDRIIKWSAAQIDIPTPAEGYEAPPVKSLLRQSDETLAFAEILILSTTTPKLREVVHATFLGHLKKTFISNSVRASQLSFLVAMMIGILCEQRNTKVHISLLSELIHEIAGVVAEPADVVSLPAVKANHLDGYKFHSGDPKLDAILTSCLENVGRHGFENTTTRMIAQTAGVSEGLVFSMFKSKLDIFVEATTLQTRLGFQENLDFVLSLNEKHGFGVANAVIIKEWMLPSRHEQRALTLEQVRMAWHDAHLRRRIEKNKNDLFAAANIPQMSATKGSPKERAGRFIEVAIPIGFYILAEIFPEASALPFVAVTQKVFS